MLRIFSISHIFAVTLTKKKELLKPLFTKNMFVSGKRHLYQNITDDP